ncbi:MAG: hypothetical protein P0Y66_22005 [Candidatus Kaistia colombiensis]|nr:MAG: hypothetical protein P0Y66_22005 [Kaistia sp.]
MWIEEAMCGAYSLVGLKSLNNLDDWWRENGLPYLEGILQGAYAFGQVDAEYVSARANALCAANHLSDDIQPISGLIFSKIASDRIIEDNIALSRVPVGTDVATFLRAWAKECGGATTTPELLLNLWTDDHARPVGAIEDEPSSAIVELGE